MPDKLVSTVAPGGTEITRTEADAQALGAQQVDPAYAEALARGEQRRKMFGSRGDQAASLVEGIIDAYTGGFVHETGEEADMRRESTPGSVLLGGMLGTALSIAGPGGHPIKSLATSGEKAGAAAAKAFLRQGEKSIVSRTLQEAGAGALMAGENALGHQLTDSIIGDHEFSGEAVLDATKLGGLMGAGGGALMGTFGKIARGANQADAAVGAGLEDMSEALSAHEAQAASYGEALHYYEQQLGAIKELRRAGKLTDVADDFIRVRTDAIKAARKAQAALKEVDVEAALSGDAKEYAALQRHMGEYHMRLSEADDIMRPHPAEMEGAAYAAEGNTKLYDRPDITKVRPVGDGDYILPASRVSEGIPNEEAYLAQYGAPPAPSAAEGTANLRKPVDLDAGSDMLPIRSATENAQAAQSVMQGPGAFAREGTEFGASGGDVGVQGAIHKMFKGGKGKGQLIAEAEGAIPTEPYAKLEEPAQPPPIPEEAIKTVGIPKQEDVARQMLDDWANVSTPRVRPWDEAQAKAQAVAQKLYGTSNGRFDSARAIGMLEKDGLRPSVDPVGAHLDAVYSMNRVAKLAAAEARGVKTPLRDLAKKALGVGTLSQVLKMAGIKHNAVFAILGYTGKLASSSGALAKKVAGAVDAFVTSTKVRSVAVAASNTPWAYSETGPIKDPVQRIQEIKALAGNPEAVRARVRAAAGDLVAIAPDHVMALENKAVQQIQALSMRAPAIYFDKLGRALQPPSGKMRQFFEFENGVNDLGSILDAVKTGSVTKPQIDALSVSWPAVYTKLVMGIINDPEKLKEYSHDKLRVAEMITGLSLTGASDPQFTLRQQMGWQSPAPQPDVAKPQAFNINPTGAPTPSQANATGRAPGN